MEMRVEPFKRFNPCILRVCSYFHHNEGLIDENSGYEKFFRAGL